MTNVANFNFKYDYSPVILWQYSDAKRLKSIVEKEQKFIDTAITQFFDEFNNNIFNLDICNSDGLELWGRLIQIPRPVINGTIATDEQYRLLLKSRLYVNVWDGTSFGLTTLLRGLFPDAVFMVVDCPPDNNDIPQPMKVRIDFGSPLTPDQEAILQMGYLDQLTGKFVYTFLPRPAGVEYEINLGRDFSTILGFAEQINPDGTWVGMTETTNMGDEDTPGTGGTFYN